MKFEVGQTVIAKERFSSLIEGRSYIINKITDLQGEDDQLLFLTGEQGGFLSFRFKLATETPQAPANTPVRYDHSAMGVTMYINHVDEGLITSGASKHDGDKADLSLIPYVSQIEHAKAFMVGEKKYGRYNYCKGMEASRIVSAALRHITAWFNGEENDPQDGQHHLGAARACLAMLLRQQELGTMKDNRYKHDNGQ